MSPQMMIPTGLFANLRCAMDFMLAPSKTKMEVKVKVKVYPTKPTYTLWIGNLVYRVIAVNLNLRNCVSEKQ